MTVARKRAGKGDDAKSGSPSTKEVVSSNGGTQKDALITPAPEQKILTKEMQALLDNAMQDMPLKFWEGTKLNCGLPYWLVQPVLTYQKTLIKRIIGVISVAVTPIEFVVCRLLKLIPSRIMHKICLGSFLLAMKLWRILPRSITNRGMDEKMTLESHLITLVMWPVRLFPMTLARMRFGMSNLVWFLPPLDNSVKEELIELPERGVRGIWLHTAPKGVEDPPVFMWVFGGAFFAGDIEGNRGFAARYAQQLGADAFIVDYRLLPEARIAEAFLDGTRAYEYLLTLKAPHKIMCGGISAGAGLLANTLQCAASTDPKVRKWAFYGTDPTPQPAGAMLIGPFVDFTIPESREAAIVKNTATDFIVTQRVLELCAPLLMGGEGSQERLRGLSPLFKDCSGMCPIHVSYSLREATTDMSAAFVEKLKAAGNDVESFTTPFLGHVFQVMMHFLPEAREAEAAAVKFMKKHLKVSDK